MPDVRAFQSVVEAAEKAAAVGDFASAEALLREAADLQEAEFGPLHPDLASTFNNLAVVCEMAERPVEAERFYRRAYAIASATLGADHALVATSRDNLRDFCQARGLPLEEWSGVPASPAAEPAPGDSRSVVPAPEPPTAPLAAPAPLPAPVPRAAAAAAVPTPEPVRATRPVPPARHSIRRASLWPALILVLLGAAAGLRLWTAPPPAPSAASANAAPAAPVATPSSPVAEPESTAAPESAPASGSARPPEPDPATPPGAPPVAPPATAAAPANARPAVMAPAAEPPARDGTPPGVRVVVATVCRSLTTRGAWRCTPAGDASAPGALTFYTRIASPSGLRVRHRWYLGDRLRQDVALRVGASPREGYRTFSRQTVGPGEWRVELRAENGALLDEARFVVR